MKILLLHEMSGVHSELKKGLRALGVDADIATFGDYHKKFSSDLNLGSTDPGLQATVSRVVRQLMNAPRMRGYDLIQSISAVPFNKALTRLIEPIVLGRGGAKLVYVAAGSDNFYRTHSATFEYRPPHARWEDPFVDGIEKRVVSQAAAVVSAAWDYHDAMRAAGAEPVFIPFPVWLDDIEPVEIGTRRKLLVYHPLNRVEGNDFKGTSLIREAFAQLREEFAGEAEFVERGGMPFEEYLKFTRDVDILVDQAFSQSYGMSALYGLARGQVVLSGNEPATHELAHYRASPVVNIRPDVAHIADTLRGLIANRTGLSEIGSRGRQFVETHHEARSVARRYLDLYRAVLGDG